MLHKILGCSTVAAALSLSVSTTQAANLLVNPGFETSPAGFTANPVTLGTVGQGWANFGNTGQSDMSSSPDSPQSGAFSLLEVNAAGNAWNPAGSYQIVPGSAGSLYTYSVWALTDTGMQGDSWTTPVDTQIQFLDASLANISTIDLGWSAIGALDTWQQYTVSGTAPAGTAYVSVYAMNMVSGANTGPVNVYFDTASLTAPVPEPTTLALAGLGGAAALSLIRRRKS